MINKIIKKLINSKFKKDLSFSYISQLLVIVFGFLQLYLINRYYGLEILGQLTIIISIVGIFSNIVTARSNEAVTKFFKIEELKNNLTNAKFIIFIGLFIDIITAIILIVAIYLLSDFLVDIFIKELDLTKELFIFSFISFFVIIRNSLVGYIQAKELFYVINNINIIDAFFKIIFLLYIIFVLNSTELIDIVYGFLFANIISSVYLFFVFLTYYKNQFKNIQLVFNKSLLNDYWRFNLKTFVSSTIKAVSQNIDNLIIAYFLNSQIVGIYQTIKKIVSPIVIVANPFAMLVYPKLIYYFEEKRKKQFINIIKKISVYLAIFSIVYTLFIFISIEFILNMMNIEYKNIYVYYLILITISNALVSLMWWVRIFSNTINPNYSINMGIFTLLYQFLVTIFITKYFGIVYMLFSIILMYSIIYLYYIKKLRKYI